MEKTLKNTKKHRRKNDFKAFSKVFFVFMILTLILFSVNFVGAFEFDNVKEYHKKTKTATIINAFGFGDEITTAKLDTPQIYQVRVGTNITLMQFTMNPKKDYENILGKLEFLNLNNGKSFEKQIYIQYWGLEDYEVNNYDCEYKKIIDWNERANCNIIGTHTKQREGWVEWDRNVKTNKEVIVRIIGNVGVDETVDIIPTIAGVEIFEWAIYTSGAVTTTDGDYTVVRYVNNGTFNYTGNSFNASILVVAGGGSGGGASSDGLAGAGAGGGLIYMNNNFTISEQNYNIIVGSGGTGVSANNGGNGGNSSFSTLNANGGGGGAVSNGGGNAVAGEDGGSGGGAGQGNGGAANGGTATPVGQGFNGGACGGSADLSAGAGGGGAGEIGEDCSATNNGGDGGNGLNFSINGTSTYYAGGGGGGGVISTGVGGLGGGGNGGLHSDNAGMTAGTDTLGGGGGGAGKGSSVAGADGGNGVIIIRFLTPNTAPTVTLNSPIDNYNSTSSSMTFNCSAYDDTNLINISLYINGTINNTNSSGLNNTNYVWTRTLTEGSYNWTCEATDNESQTTTATYRSFEIDTTAPTIVIIYPINSTTYLDGYVTTTNKSIDLNWTTTDTNLDDCWYYNTTENVTVACNNNATINLTYGTYTFNVYANDTFRHETEEKVTATWNYTILENSLYYDSSALMGSTQSFSTNITYDNNKFTNSISYLVWNGTSYTATRTGSSGNYNFSKSLSIPDVSTAANITFYWSFVLNNGTDNTYNSSSYTQLVNTLLAGNCSTYNYTLYNFTIVNEKTQVELNETATNSSAKINLQIYDSTGTTMVQNYSAFYDEVNPFAICLNDNLSDGEIYEIDLEIEYDADGYAHEFYNIQDETLTSADMNTAITLYDLDDTSAQEFKITYKNGNFLPVADALIQIQRKYIDEGLFKTVEIPKTDSNGETIAHLELSDVIYTIIVTKASSTLATFNNIIAYCDNVATGDCEINLNVFSSTIEVEDFATSDDFSYTFDWDDSTRTITVIYTITSGAVSTVELNTTLFDQLGNTSVCSDTLTSSSGTLTCIVPASFGNSTVIAKLTKAGDFIGQAVIGINQDPSEIYGSSIVFLSLFLMITIIGLGISSNPMITGFFLLMGGILSVALNLTDSVGFFGAGATILWLFIAIIIILIKGSKRQ